MTIIFNKPYGVLSQFTPEKGSDWKTLALYGLPKGVYSAGRLDADSEGMLILSDNHDLVTELLDPTRGHPRQYWVQIEGIPEQTALELLRNGVKIGDHVTKPSNVWLIDPTPSLPPRNPPIRVRKSIPDTWIALTLTEGKNRQVRRMTAAVGHPTLRLYRSRIGKLELSTYKLKPGAWQELTAEEQKQLLAR
ncbi:MAG: pseudouridine synthase [Verrucomicrobia bacterium]|jgi:23S rRNA pseudouridine2457 synthase|nr:MAG: pseudouridine synthase [Verrucomicrobiota bacterium]